MGITIYGRQTTKFRLPHEAKAFAAGDLVKPRTLEVKILSKRQAREYEKRVDAANALEGDARDAAIDALLKDVVVGWENIDAPFTIEGLSDQFTAAEFNSIVNLIPYVAALTEADLKKSGSPS